MRDKKICQKCGDKAHHIHHIYPLHKIIQDFQNKHPDIDITKDCYYVATLIISESEVFRDLNNLVALCESCHKDVHRKQCTTKN